MANIFDGRLILANMPSYLRLLLRGYKDTIFYLASFVWCPIIASRGIIEFFNIVKKMKVFKVIKENAGIENW